MFWLTPFETPFPPSNFHKGLGIVGSASKGWTVYIVDFVRYQLFSRKMGKEHLYQYTLMLRVEKKEDIDWTASGKAHSPSCPKQDVPKSSASN